MDPRISRGEGTYAICIAPTRELCLQIHDVASAVLKRCGERRVEGVLSCPQVALVVLHFP